MAGGTTTYVGRRPDDLRRLHGAHQRRADEKSCVVLSRRWPAGRSRRLRGSARSDARGQRAWIEEHVPQCGYWQSGQIMAAVAASRRIRSRPTPTSMPPMAEHLPVAGAYEGDSQSHYRAATEVRDERPVFFAAAGPSFASARGGAPACSLVLVLRARGRGPRARRDARRSTSDVHVGTDDMVMASFIRRGWARARSRRSRCCCRRAGVRQNDRSGPSSPASTARPGRLRASSAARAFERRGTRSARPERPRATCSSPRPPRAGMSRRHNAARKTGAVVNPETKERAHIRSARDRGCQARAAGETRR